MQKLREIGFKGIFDIQCDDRIGAKLFSTRSKRMYTNKDPLVSRQLISMIPGFKSSNLSMEEVRVVSELGAVKVSSLDHNESRKGSFNLQEADLAVCAAEDIVLRKEKLATIFNATSYIGLEPTDWKRGSCFITDQDGIVSGLSPASEMRLSSAMSIQLPDIRSILLSETERRIIDITKNMGINSQLVYGLYPEMDFNIESNRMQVSGNLDESVEMQRIVDANLLLSQKMGKTCILLLPQQIALNSHFREKMQIANRNINFVDLTKCDLNINDYKSGDIIVAHTGNLQQKVFDHLMLQGTTLPPVIEGCNSREICESAGSPFIHGSGKHSHLKQYDVSSIKQELHTQASLCLEQGDPKYIPQLAQYMEESLVSNPELLDYHTQRKEAFLKRPDACEYALDALGIKYNKGKFSTTKKEGINPEQLIKKQIDQDLVANPIAKISANFVGNLLQIVAANRAGEDDVNLEKDERKTRRTSPPCQFNR